MTINFRRLSLARKRASCPRIGPRRGPSATHNRADVGFEGLSGNRMLDQSITGFDPEPTSHRCHHACECHCRGNVIS